MVGRSRVEMLVRRTESLSPAEVTALWQKVLTDGHPVLGVLRRTMRWLPGAPRCKVCNNPFGGFGGHVCRAIGFTPSRKSPQLCAACCEKMPLGGAEVETAILFVDVRGSSALAEQLGPAAYALLLNRFYRTANDVLVRYDATIDKLIGDEVMAFFIPGFAGPAFARSAVEAGRSLLRSVGYGRAEGPWIPLGIGIDVGISFVGNVGQEDYFDFTALGEPVNTAARIRAAAQPGELLVSEAAYASVADLHPDSPQRTLEIKGRQERLRVRSIPIGADRRVH